jgi:hypothetical protein
MLVLLNESEQLNKVMASCGAHRIGQCPCVPIKETIISEQKDDDKKIYEGFDEHGSYLLVWTELLSLLISFAAAAATSRSIFSTCEQRSQFEIKM